MGRKIYLRRIVALFLCLVLAFVSSVPVASASDPVTAATLTIAGGQLAGAGLTGEAALSLAGPVGAVVGVALGALGLNAYVSKASQQAGKTRTRFVCDQLMLWAYQAGYTKEQFYTKIAQGISVAADGTIQLSKDVAQSIMQFGNWLVTQEGTVVPAPSPSSDSTVNLGSLGSTLFTSEFQYLVDNRYLTVRAFELNTSTPKSVGLVGIRGNASDTSVRIGAFSNEAFDASFHFGSGGTGGHAYPGNNGVPYAAFMGQSGIPVIPVSAAESAGILVYTGSFISFLSSITQFSPADAVPAQDCFLGDVTTWDQNKDLLNPSADGVSIVLNPDLLNPIIDSLTAGQQATMGIMDYLQALQDTWDHALDDVQTALGTITDTLTGIQEEIAIPDTAVQDPAITNPSVAPDTTPILNPSDVDPGTVVTGLSFDLTQIFPFCIPFDIYDMLATLSATPEAPVYHVHYVAPYNIVIDFTVDLSPWDSVAAVLRTVELLAFCIGLAYVTRSMFIRS